MPYESTHDLPSFRQLEQQLAVLRLLPGPGRTTAEHVERQMRELAETVDAFYELLSPKHWIFHESLSVTAVQTILTEAQNNVDRAEEMLIDHYHEKERLFFMSVPLKKQPAMRRRLPLVERAREDYFAGRYYACIHVLLSVMDGFVNEFETVRRGLHAREAEELRAWDSVVGHHFGLTHAHKTFTKGRSTTNEEPVYELYRNGIVHGSILNYDNIIVATKAWNRLFAVVDWACTRDKEQQQEAAEALTRAGQAQQCKDLFGTLVQRAEIDRINRQWTAREHLPDAEEFTAHPAQVLTSKLLTWWTARNYGSMSDLITHAAHKKHGNAIRSEIRRAYADFPLESFVVLAIRHDMPAACTATARLDRANGETVTAQLRWIREDPDAYPIPEPRPGEWRLSTWKPSELVAG
ncbi:hypothetical protein LO772_30375 [Yinghuangia sp. ASG 101]|uniref:hypothetical protein n=1 Tax=Yinghuangia sp. ASG 101 TaxID=2896848 RepID=UPI001E442890|nr:hypothetical protein [Yinghuangia sp. ASG 101]UGQ11068.1 hypothetical protein LO772_30375 [Yinghuangia sp. ASG 101]